MKIRHLLWKGPSQLDGKPIVLLALSSTTNRKTGHMVQTYILRADIPPITAMQTGEDTSICGDCLHRELGTCYVRIDTGPTMVWKAYRTGKYPQLRLRDFSRTFARRLVRLGTYGDPAAVPLEIWGRVLKTAGGHTGYTHQWQHKQFAGLKDYCMASCDSIREKRWAEYLGWRTFTVIPNLESQKPHNSFLCPASEEAGKKLTCDQCLACGGLSSIHTAHVYIPVHGLQYKRERFNNLIQIGRKS